MFDLSMMSDEEGAPADAPLELIDASGLEQLVPRVLAHAQLPQAHAERPDVHLLVIGLLVHNLVNGILPCSLLAQL